MKPLSVYVHIPFCTVKCGYCDFNAYAGMDALKGDYRSALLAEIDAYTETLAGSEIVSIGFGGGTPGEVPASHIGDIIRAIEGCAPLAANAEVTLEANPGTATPAYLAALRDCGVTRLSLGAQSFDPEHLRFLDRIHSVEAIGASLRAARAAGFASANLDLIYGLPRQSVDHWRHQLNRAIALGPDHLSLYALTVEEGTPLHRRVESGEVVMPDPDTVAEMYELAETALQSAGFHHYELSNWALPGHESRHNIGYWTDREYLGIGAGAHGYVHGRRYENIAHPRQYIGAALSSDPPVAAVHELSPEAWVSDWVTLRLRLVDGFHPHKFRDRFGIDIRVALGAPLQSAVEAGWLECTPEAIRLTPRGRLLHGELAVRLVDHLDRHPGLPPAAPQL